MRLLPQTLRITSEFKMPRIFKIIGGVIITAAAVVRFIPSNVTERAEQPDFAEFRASISELCTWLKLQEADHITRSPRLVAVTIPRPWEIYEPYDQTARICRPSETVLTLPEAMLALFDGRDADCTTTSEQPASVLVALTTSFVPEEPTAASTVPRKTGV